MKWCRICGGKVEGYNGRTVCHGCYLDSLIPNDYQRRESYAYIDAYGHSNAIKHPPMGIPILDESREPLRDQAMRLKGKQLPLE